MEVYAVNNTVGLEGLCATLLVFRTIPRPIRTNVSPSQLARASSIDQAMDAASKEQLKRRIKFGLRHYDGPKATEDVNKLRDLPSGAKVMVYRTTSKLWEGPHLFVSEDGRTSIVQTRAARRIFRSTPVKPWTERNTNARLWDASPETDSITNVRADTQVSLGRDRKTKPQSKDLIITSKSFDETRRQEIRGLIKNGTFQTSNISEIPKGTRIFGIPDLWTS